MQKEKEKKKKKKDFPTRERKEEGGKNANVPLSLDVPSLNDNIIVPGKKGKREKGGDLILKGREGEGGGPSKDTGSSSTQSNRKPPNPFPRLSINVNQGKRKKGKGTHHQGRKKGRRGGKTWRVTVTR